MHPWEDSNFLPRAYGAKIKTWTWIFLICPRMSFIRLSWRRLLLFQMSYRDISLSLSWCACRLCASTFHSPVSASKLTISCTVSSSCPSLDSLVWDTTLNGLMLAKDEQMLAWTIFDWWYVLSWNLDHFVFPLCYLLKIATGSTRNSVIHLTRMAPHFSATVANVIGCPSIHHKCRWESSHVGLV